MNKTAEDDCYVLPANHKTLSRPVSNRTAPDDGRFTLKSVYPLRILRPSTDPDVSIKVDLPYHKPLPA